MKRQTEPRIEPPDLIGRDYELSVLSDLMSRPGRGGSLLVRGQAGIGKSALIEQTTSIAAGRTRVLYASGTISEQDLAFAGLHQLIRPVLPLASALPEPRRTALEIAFGSERGPVPGLHLVAMAVLDLLTELAAERPVLAVAEDVHVMDVATREVLAFVGRRLEFDAVVLIATGRDDADTSPLDQAVRTLQLRPLSRDESDVLLEQAAPTLGEPLRQRILALSEGNPLALIELAQHPDSISAAQDPTWVTLSERLQSSFATRIESLTHPTRRLIELLAVNDSESLSELLNAANIIGLTESKMSDLDLAVDAKLIVVASDRVRFRHPLMRATVRQLTSPSKLVQCYLALSEAIGPATDRGILHRARAASGFDEDLATELEGAAGRFADRGDMSAAVRAYGRVSELSPSVPVEQRVLFRAAGLAYEMGDRHTGDAYRQRFTNLVRDEISLLQLERLVEIADVGTAGGRYRIQLLLSLAERAAGVGETQLANSFLRSAAYRCWMREPDLWTSGGLVRYVAESTALEDVDRAVVLAYADPVGSAEEVGTLLRRIDQHQLDSVSIHFLGHSASCIGDFELADGFYEETTARLRAEGRLQALARSLVLQSWAQLRRGLWSTAMPLAEEGHRLAQETSQLEWEAAGLAGQGMVAALRGESTDAGLMASKAEQMALPGQMRLVLAVSNLVRATAAAGDGDYLQAWELLMRMYNEAEPAYHPYQALWSLSQLAHAGLMADRVEETRGVMDHLLTVLPTGSDGPKSPAPRMNVLYARALLAGDDTIISRLEAALASEVGHWPWERCRLQLVLGTLLRRRRSPDARAALRAARDGFDDLGAKAWSQRARDELRASGVRSPTVVSAAWSNLSPQELQIARMAAEGMSNRQIGEKLYLSHRTVGSHLYRIFPKLGITSRNQLSGLSLGGSLVADIDSPE